MTEYATFPNTAKGWKDMSDTVPLLCVNAMKSARLHNEGFELFEINPPVSFAECLGEMKDSELTSRAAPSFGCLRDAWPRRQLNNLMQVAIDNPTLLVCTRRMLQYAECALAANGFINTQRSTTMWRLIGAEHAVKRQVDHCDYNPKKLLSCDDDAVPLVVIVAMCEQCTLDVSPRTHRGRTADFVHTRIRVRIPLGCMLIMRGDVVHAGSPYDRGAWRLHCDVHDHKIGRRSILQPSGENCLSVSFRNTLQQELTDRLPLKHMNPTVSTSPADAVHSCKRNRSTPMRHNKRVARVMVENSH